jgi:hypothetical protein
MDFAKSLSNIILISEFDLALDFISSVVFVTTRRTQVKRRVLLSPSILIAYPR